MDEFQIVVLPSGEEVELPAGMSDADIEVALSSLGSDAPAKEPPAAPLDMGAEMAKAEKPAPHSMGAGVPAIVGAGLSAAAPKLPGMVETAGRVVSSNLPSKIISGGVGLAGAAGGAVTGGPIGGIAGGPLGYHASRYVTQKGGKAIEEAGKMARTGPIDPVKEILQRSVDLENKALVAKDAATQKALTLEAKKLERQANRMMNQNRVARATGAKAPNVAPRMGAMAKGIRGASNLMNRVSPLLMLYDLFSSASEHERTMPDAERNAYERLNPMMGVARGNTGMEQFEEELLKRSR